MHELTGTGKTGCGRRSLAQPQHEVASWDGRWAWGVDSLATPWRPSGIGISPVGYSVKHDADGVGAAL